MSAAVPTLAPASLPWWRKTRTALLAAFLVVVAAAMIAFLADVGRDYRRAEAVALQRQAELAAALAQSTRLLLERYLVAARLAADALGGGAVPDVGRVEPLLGRLRRIVPDAALAVLTADGQLAVGLPRGAEGLDLGDRRFVLELAAGAREAVSELGAGWLGRPLDVVVAAPAREDDGSLRAIVAFALPATILGEELRVRFSEGAYPLLVDWMGRVVVHGRLPYLAAEHRDFAGLPLVARALEGHAASTTAFVAPDDGEARAAAMAPVPGIGWAAGVVQPVDAFLAVARAERRAALWAAGTVLALGVGLALVLSAWLGRPIERLAAGVAAFGRGDLAYRVPARGRSELDWLAGEVNGMARRLSQSREELAAASREAETERRRLEATLESLPDAVLISDARGVLVLVNRAARQLLGAVYAPGWALLDAGAPSRPATTPAGEPAGVGELPLERALRGEPVADVRLAIDSPTLGRRHVSATAVLVRSGSGERVGAVAVLRDLTDHEALESLKDRFILRASHELRTPLTAIRGTLAFLRRGVEGRTAEVAQDLLAMAARNAEQMASLVEDLLDASRLRAGRLAISLRPVALDEVIEAAVHSLAPLAAERQVRVEVRGSRAACRVDPLRLEQVVANLVGNAVKFTPAGRRVTIAAERRGDRVEIRVRDEGVGLAREHLDRVFDPFFQVAAVGNASRRRGAGLGLTVARALVELHGGRIWAESEGPGHGSTFVVALPCQDAGSRGMCATTA